MKQPKKNTPQAYEAPHVEIMEIAVEQGFTTSTSVETLNWNGEQGWE